MIHDVRVAIPIIGSKDWLGGISYIELLVKAVASLPAADRPQLFHFVTIETLESFPLHAPIRHLFDGYIVLGDLALPEVDPAVVTRVESYEELFQRIDFFYPVLSGVWPNTPSASWIPDFQHVFLPQFFSAEEQQRRSAHFEQIAGHAPLVVFSSLDAQQTFTRLFPQSKATARVLPFYSLPQKEWYDKAYLDTQHKYGLPDNFLICCNQFWVHKNHPLLLEAIARLRREGRDVHLVCTGATEDYRARDYFQEVRQKIEESGIDDLVHIVGNIPRRDQIQLIRRAMAVIQPSLFEGWSTVVEDCRVLGKVMVLSDLAVHQEQAPRFGAFFDRHNAEDLSRKIAALLPELSPGPDTAKEQLACEEAYRLAEEFGRQFCSIVADAGKIFGFEASTNRPTSSATTATRQNVSVFPESRLAHQWLDGLKGLEIGPSAHNPFGLNTRNVGLKFEGYEQEQKSLTGSVAPIHLIAPADEIPVPVDSEDFVLSSHVIEHCPDMIKALVEWYRVIRKGGYLYMIVPFRDAAPTDKGRPLTDWGHVVGDYLAGVTGETEPEANGIPFGYCHYHVFDINSMHGFMQHIFGDRLELVDHQTRDDKIGNGFTLVYRKTKSFAESFPWSISDGTRQAFIRKPGTLKQPIDPSEVVLIAANLVPFRDAGQRQRQDVGIASITALAAKGIVPLNICYPDELLESAGWQTAPILQRSANVELGIDGKRKPFVIDLFDIAAEWAATRGIEWLALTNSDIVLTEALVAELRRLQADGVETVAVSRNEVERIEADGRLVSGYLEVNGYDVFLCKTSWWRENRHLFQHYIYGERAWDDAYAAIMACHSRFAMLYRDGLCFHFKHPTSWISGPYSDYNMGLYTGADKPYSDRYEAFIKEVLALTKPQLTPVKTAELLAKHFSPATPAPAEPARGFVNIGMITYNRLDFTKPCLEAFERTVDYPHRLTVIDNNSQDGTREYLREMHARGVIHNLVLLDENVGVAKASNLAWALEPDAAYYMKLDNDIVFQKHGWLSRLVEVIERVPQIGAVGYNFEPASYPLYEINGCRVRIKEPGNLGGACILIPKRTERILGNWCEDYGLYGEEDADYGFRIRCTGLLNAYMEDEEIGFHLPAGRAAAIDSATLVALDGHEEELHAEYRKWKDELRRRNVHGPFKRNLERYANDPASRFLPSRFATEWLESRRQERESGAARMATDSPRLKVALLSLDLRDHACMQLRVSGPISALADRAELLPAVTNDGRNYHFSREAIDAADLVVVQRFFPRPETRSYLEQAQASGKPVIYEVDDLVTDLPPANRELNRHCAAEIADLIARASAVTVSTELLGSSLPPCGGKIHVLPNLLDERLWGTPPPPRKERRPRGRRLCRHPRPRGGPCRGRGRPGAHRPQVRRQGGIPLLRLYHRAARKTFRLFLHPL